MRFNETTDNKTIILQKYLDILMNETIIRSHVVEPAAHILGFSPRSRWLQACPSTDPNTNITTYYFCIPQLANPTASLSVHLGSTQSLSFSITNNGDSDASMSVSSSLTWTTTTSNSITASPPLNDFNLVGSHSFTVSVFCSHTSTHYSLQINVLNDPPAFNP